MVAVSLSARLSWRDGEIFEILLQIFCVNGLTGHTGFLIILMYVAAA